MPPPRAAALSPDAAAAPPPLRPGAAADAVVWASLHGMVSRKRQDGNRGVDGAALTRPLPSSQVVGLGGAAPPAALIHAPLAASPASIPRAAFEAAVAAAPAFNALASAVSRDAPWLAATLAPAAAADPFTARLLALAADAEAAPGRKRPLDCLVSRSDYLAHAPAAGALLQVELNTIASSFGCLGDAATAMHRALAVDAGWPEAALARLPANGARASIAAGLAAAAAEHGAGGIALFIVQPGERNAYDQAALAAARGEGHGVRVARATLADVASRASLSGAGALTFDAHRVSLVYYRAGYGPGDYPTETEWAARSLLERSDAALCPSARLQLAGAKKVQQELARAGVTERFVGGAEAAAARRHYAGLWSLDPPALADPESPSSVAVADALAHPDAYVLKPQREGGGNNEYGPALAARLAARAPDLAARVLMQRILPPPATATLVREGREATAASVSELGVFGVCVSRGDSILVNAAAGHLLRTTPADADEGGVASGYAVLDSPYLTG